jgi:hypothetical protein
VKTNYQSQRRQLIYSGIATSIRLTMYEGDVELSTTVKLVKGINILRAMIYFFVVGVQLVHCSTEIISCGAMIVLVPLFLGVMDSLLIWASGRDTMGVKFGSISLSIVSIIVAFNTLTPILYGSGPITDYLYFMFYLSFGVIIMSALEIIVVFFDLASPKESLEDLRFSSSTRTY